jgi:hypothetical protein
LFLWRVWWHWCTLAKRDSKSDQCYRLLICKSIQNDNRWWPACYRYVFLLFKLWQFLFFVLFIRIIPYLELLHVIYIYRRLPLEGLNICRNKYSP